MYLIILYVVVSTPDIRPNDNITFLISSTEEKNIRFFSKRQYTY